MSASKTKDLRTIQTFIKKQDESFIGTDPFLVSIENRPYLDTQTAMTMWHEVDEDNSGDVTLLEAKKFFTLKMTILDKNILNPKNNIIKNMVNNIAT